MNTEIQKHAAKCERYRKKIAEFQALLDEAEKKKTEAENAYIISKVRGSGYTTDELMEAVLLLKSQQNGKVSAGQGNNKSMPDNPENESSPPAGLAQPPNLDSYGEGDMAGTEKDKEEYAVES